MTARPFDWHEYFKLAQELAARKDEARLRSALSRAYYYVYHLALNRAKLNGFAPRAGESTHMQLWRLFELSPEPECMSLGHVALRLKEKRERADYEPVYRRLEDEVLPILEDAQEFAVRLGKLPQRHPDPKSQRQ